MIRAKLQYFIASVTKRQFISAPDVRRLAYVLEGGLVNRSEAEALMELDRTLEAHETWAHAFASHIVHFIVWRSTPTGMVTADEAAWLTAALDLGGPTQTAMTIAYAILDESPNVDIAILDFIMRGRQAARLRIAA